MSGGRLINQGKRVAHAGESNANIGSDCGKEQERKKKEKGNRPMGGMSKRDRQ